MYYDNVSEKNRERYAGGFIWQMPVTSHYPNEGFKIPYEKYIDNDEIINNIYMFQNKVIISSTLQNI